MILFTSLYRFLLLSRPPCWCCRWRNVLTRAICCDVYMYIVYSLRFYQVWSRKESAPAHTADASMLCRVAVKRTTATKKNKSSAYILMHARRREIYGCRDRADTRNIYTYTAAEQKQPRRRRHHPAWSIDKHIATRCTARLSYIYII